MTFTSSRERRPSARRRPGGCGVDAARLFSCENKGPATRRLRRAHRPHRRSSRSSSSRRVMISPCRCRTRRCSHGNQPGVASATRWTPLRCPRSVPRPTSAPISRGGTRRSARSRRPRKTAGRTSGTGRLLRRPRRAGEAGIRADDVLLVAPSHGGWRPSRTSVAAMRWKQRCRCPCAKGNLTGAYEPPPAGAVGGAGSTGTGMAAGGRGNAVS